MDNIGLFLAILLLSTFSVKQRVLSAPSREKCPDVRAMKDFNIFNILGSWYVVQYYSSSEEALTYHCMRAEFGLSSGYMDMIMKLTYIYADDPGEEAQTGNMTWQIPDPRRPEHWRHTENPYKGVYNTDVIDTDYTTWLILLHCSDPESEKKFLSTFVLSRTAYIDKLTTDYLREKIGHYNVPMEYLFGVNQTFCFGESGYLQQTQQNGSFDTTTLNLQPTDATKLEEGEETDEYASLNDDTNSDNINDENS
ncbi:unnamed protein product [Orchesella dallaii]|uniref:Apolipoprotein D n=1 Tax=Orchesella dallaii TaxID=48710 RepID=A0ABP1RE98_9HEXA